MRSHPPYGVLIPIVVVACAVALMLWAMAGTSGPSRSDLDRPGGAIPPVSSEPAVGVPGRQANDPGADSARGSLGPHNDSK